VQIRGILATVVLEYDTGTTPATANWTDIPKGQGIQLTAGVGHTGLINAVSVILNTQNIPIHLQGLNALNRFVTAQFRTTDKKQHMYNERMNFTYAPDIEADYSAAIGNVIEDGSQEQNILRYSREADGDQGVTLPLILPFFPFSLEPQVIKNLSSAQSMRMDKYFPPNTQMRINFDLTPQEMLIDQMSQRAGAVPDLTLLKKVRYRIPNMVIITNTVTAPMDSRFLAQFNAQHSKAPLCYPVTVPREHSLAVISGLDSTLNVLPLIPTTPELIKLFFLTNMLEMRNFQFPTALRGIRVQCGDHVLLEVKDMGTKIRNITKNLTYETQEKYLRSKCGPAEFFDGVRYDQVLTVEMGRIKQFYTGFPPQLEIYCDWDKAGGKKSPPNTFIVVHTTTAGNLLLSKNAISELIET
jgi:hypothetical protein